MSVASELKNCPKCGGPISTEAPQGLCPKCLLLQASMPTEAGKAADSKSPPPTREEVAAAFPQLEILELIGQGGMGFVFKARQPKLERLVALKILPQALAADPAFAERFTREGRVLARLNHPNIVTIHDFGQANGYFYLLMEFVDGVNLREAMKVGRFTPEQALAIVPKICDALQFAHNEGILHRDIKPENILLDAKGRVKIADFGIAKIVGTESSERLDPNIEAAPQKNVTGIIGTPRYMAPEQLEHPQTVDQRADIYSLGVVFYEMLTGELPLGRFAPPSEKSSADPRLDEVVLRALEKEPNRRTQSAEEVKTQVETISGSAPSPGISVAAKAANVTGERWGFREFAPYLRRGALAGLFVFLLILSGATITSFMLPEIYMGVARVEINAPVAGGYDPYRIQIEMDTMQTPDFLRRVAASLDLGRRWRARYTRGPALEDEAVMRSLRNALQISNRNNTPLLELRFYSESASEAAEIANKIAEIYCALPPGNRGRIIDSAMPPPTPARPNIPLNISIGAVAGAILGILTSIAVGLFSFWRRNQGAKKAGLFGDPRDEVAAARSATGWLSQHSLRKWSPFQSPFASPEVREIKSHFTSTEANQFSLLELVTGVWIVASIFGISGLIRSSPAPGSWMLALVWGILVVVSYPTLFRIQRQFLCSTAWGRRQGLKPDQFKLLSFDRIISWKELVFTIGFVALGFFLSKGLFPRRYFPNLDPNLRTPAQELPIRATSRPFVARLPQGTIELVAVGTGASHYPTTNVIDWWRPDGKRIDRLHYDYPPGFSSTSGSDDSMFRQLVFKTRGLPSDASGLAVSEVEPAGNSGSMGNVYLDGKVQPDITLGDLELPPAAKTARIKVSVATEPWTNGFPITGIFRQGGSAGNGFNHGGVQWRVKLQNIEEINGATKIIAYHTVKEGWQSELVFVDLDGKEWMPQRVDESWEQGLRHLSGTCNLPLAKIKEAHLRVRRYQSVEFRNVSLQPDQRTEVEIVNAIGAKSATNTSTSTSPSESHDPVDAQLTKTIALTKTMNESGRISIWTDSRFPPGEAVVAVMKYPDGRVEDAMTQTITQRGQADPRTTTVFSWQMPDFNMHAMEASQLQVQRNTAGGKIVLEANKQFLLFAATNRADGIYVGYLEFRPVSAADAQAANRAGQPMSASVRFSSVTNVNHMVLGYFTSAVPADHVLQAGALESDGREADVNTSIARSADSDNENCRWDFPDEFTARQMQSAMEQIKGVKGRLIVVPSGKRTPLFSVTNDAGDIYQGFFELLAPSLETKTKGEVARAIGSLHLIGAGSRFNLASARAESVTGYPLHQIIARLAGPALETKQWGLARSAATGPTLAPAPEEKLGEGWKPEPVESDSIWNSDNDLTIQASSEIFECPNECQLQFALADEGEAEEAVRQINVALAKPIDLFPGERIKLFQVGEREAWLEIREFRVVPGKLGFIGHWNRNVGKSPAYSKAFEENPTNRIYYFVHSAVVSIPPNADLNLTINLTDIPAPLFSAILDSKSDKPGLYWLTWYALDGSGLPARTGGSWEIFVHDAQTARELRHLKSTGKPETEWRSCEYTERTNEIPGKAFEKWLFYGPDPTGAKVNPRYPFVNASMTMRPKSNEPSSK